MASSPGANGNNGPRPVPQPVRAPRRLVLLSAGEDSAVEKVLAEYPGEEARRVHQDIQQLAAQYPGRLIAAEWLSPRGWKRFLYCRK
jgi:hypothetical protein